MAEVVEKEKSENKNELNGIGDNLSFEGVEAFNLLRTNLLFSFSDNKKGHVIGITSAISETGKSTISCNIAYYLAKTEKKILLIDCDLRLSTVAKKLKLSTKPGISNILVSNLNLAGTLQKFNNILDVLVAGEVPPNPTELLNSQKFTDFVNEVKENYDYIIIDLPPINIVSDALVVSKNIDGFVLVVRKDHDEKQELKEMIRKIDLANGKIIGMVFNDSKIEENNK